MNGSGFGTKATAAPFVWDDASGTSPSQKWDGYWPNCAGDHQWDVAYRMPIRGVSLPHPRITKYLAGAHNATGTVDGTCGRNVNVWKFKNVTYPSYTYISWYQRSDPNSVFGMQEGDNNYKIVSIDSPFVDPYDGSSIISNINASVPWSPPGSFSWNIYDGGGDRFSYPDQNGNGHYWDSAEDYFGSSWVKIELEILHDTGPGGRMKFWENGTLKIDYLGKTANSGESQITLGIGGYFRNNPNPNNWRYFSDIYFDNYPNRVLLCQGGTYTSRGICENQRPTQWGTGSATLTVNAGRFADGSIAYLYVCDSIGTCNSDGTPITIAASGGGDTVPPAAPTGLSVQ